MSLPHEGRGVFYGVHDGGVAAAATKMRRWARCGESGFDLRVGGIGIVFEKLRGDDHHTALAEAAKRSLLRDPGLLDGMKHRLGVVRRKTFEFGPTSGKTFQRGDFLIADGGEGRDAGTDLFAVEQIGRASCRERV